MKEAAAEARDHHARQRQCVARCEGQADEADRIDGQADAQEFLAAEAIGHHAHHVAGQEVGDEQRGDEESGVIDCVTMEVFLDGQIQRDERHLVDVREGVQHRGERERAVAVMVLAHGVGIASSCE